MCGMLENAVRSSPVLVRNADGAPIQFVADEPAVNVHDVFQPLDREAAHRRRTVEVRLDEPSQFRHALEGKPRVILVERQIENCATAKC